MFIGRLQLEGFRGAEHLVVDGARVARLAEGPSGSAVADGLDLLAVALDPSRARATADRLGWWADGSQVVGEGSDVELHGLRAPAVGAIILPGARALTIEAALHLDPPLFGRMREHAARDPRMVLALGSEPVVHVKVGWLVSRDRATAHPSVLHFRVGDVGFDTAGKERPGWLPELLVDLGGRFHRTDPFEAPGIVAERLLAATLSPDPAVRAGYATMRRALSAEPFSLPEPGLVRAGDRLDLSFGDDLRTARQVGRAAVDALRWAEAAFVIRPDVLVLDEGTASGASREWWSALVEADDAPVEQVWLR